MWLDAHAHLQLSQTEREPVTDSVPDGVRVFCNSTCEGDWKDVSRLASASPCVVPFYGIHPWFVNKISEGWPGRLRELLRSSGGGVGEIGLDKVNGKDDYDLQKSVFREQFGIAMELNRPVTLHCVRAFKDVFNIMDDYGENHPAVLFHSFSGSGEVLKEILDRGGYLSFNFHLLNDGYLKMKEAFMYAPLDRCLIETDYPFIPEYMKEELPYSEIVKMLYSELSGLRNLGVEELRERAERNGSVFLQ